MNRTIRVTTPTVLHDIADDAELVKVAATALGTEGLLERDLAQSQQLMAHGSPISPYLNVVDVVPVPGSAEELVTKPKDEDVLDHLLAQVVVDTEELLLLPVGGQSALELTRAPEILTEGLLHLFPVSA